MMAKPTAVQKFKKELLKELCKNSGHTIQINELGNKYMGTDITFKFGDETKIKLRLAINGVIRDLEKMNWITVNPTGGFNTVHKQMNPFSTDKKRMFTMVHMPVYARMNSFGEIEYKKTLTPVYLKWYFIFLIYPIVAILIGWLLTTEVTKWQNQPIQSKQNSIKQTKDTVQIKK